MSKNKERYGIDKVLHSRHDKDQDQKMVKYYYSAILDVDQDIFEGAVKCNMAHTIMLFEQNLITLKDANALLSALIELDNMKIDQDLCLDNTKGDLYFNIEFFITSKCGSDIGGKLQMGRSRIDMNNATRRYAARKGLLQIFDRLLNLIEALLKLSRKYANTLMPGYTHLQPAQPITYGFYLLGFADCLFRDLNRLHSAYGHNNLNPLGTVATAGTSWPLDRDRTALLLGFDDLIECGADAGLNADEKLEIASSCSILMNNICRRAFDYMIWTTDEFDLVELDGAFAGTSSFMPQKKNPYPFELMRCKAADVVGDMLKSFEILRAETSGFPDYGITGPGIMSRILNNTCGMVDFFIPVIQTLKIKEKNMKKAAGRGFSTAVMLADKIVEMENLPFREAHMIVGRLIKIAKDQNINSGDITGPLLDEAACQIIGKPLGIPDSIIQDSLDPRNFVESRITRGGTQGDEVVRMLRNRSYKLEMEKEKLATKHEKIQKGLSLLLSEAKNILDCKIS